MSEAELRAETFLHKLAIFLIDAHYAIGAGDHRLPVLPGTESVDDFSLAL